MKYCLRCGAPIGDGQRFCGYCGLRQPESGYLCKNSVKAGFPAQAAALPRASALPYLIWSIFLFFAINLLGTPLSIAAALFAAKANARDCSDNQKDLLYARVFCIAATAVDILTFAFLIIHAVLVHT